jgi:hypothetical protein
MRIIDNLNTELEHIDLQEPGCEPEYSQAEGEEIVLEEISDEYKKVYVWIQKRVLELAELSKTQLAEPDPNKKEKLGQELYLRARILKNVNESLFISMRLETGVLYDDIGFRKGWKLIKTPMSLDATRLGPISVIIGEPTSEEADFDNIIFPSDWEKKVN